MKQRKTEDNEAKEEEEDNEAMEANKRIKERKQMHQSNQENNKKKKENTGNYNMDTKDMDTKNINETNNGTNLNNQRKKAAKTNQTIASSIPQIAPCGYYWPSICKILLWLASELTISAALWIGVGSGSGFTCDVFLWTCINWRLIRSVPRRF